jgi:hypothetical protein
MMPNPDRTYNEKLRFFWSHDDSELEAIAQDWRKKTFLQKLLAWCNPFTDDSELDAIVAHDLLEARAHPRGRVAKRVERATSRKI